MHLMHVIETGCALSQRWDCRRHRSRHQRWAGVVFVHRCCSILRKSCLDVLRVNVMAVGLVVADEKKNFMARSEATWCYLRMTGY